MPKTALAPKLHITRNTEVERSSLRLERRAEARQPAKGLLAASYSGNGRVGITQIEIVDRSVSGLGVRSRVQIEPGMAIAICPEGASIPWLSGRAVRCVPEKDGWRVGIAFNPRRAA